MTARRFLATRLHGVHAALDDLDGALAEARDEGFPVPSDVALANARRLLKEINGNAGRRVEIYPTPDGEIVIDTSSGPGCSVLLLCASDGEVLCLVNMNGKHRRARYPDAGGLPDSFVWDALVELARRRRFSGLLADHEPPRSCLSD